MGALCCVPVGPHGPKSNTSGRDCSIDPSEPHWRTNSSYSPHLSRRWDCSSQSDELSNRVHEVPISGSSMSLHSNVRHIGAVTWIITILCLMGHYLIQGAHLTFSRHVDGHHVCIDMILGSSLHLQEVQGLKLLSFPGAVREVSLLGTVSVLHFHH